MPLPLAALKAMAQPFRLAMAFAAQAPAVMRRPVCHMQRSGLHTIMLTDSNRR
jgi:hypothetical protein